MPRRWLLGLFLLHLLPFATRPALIGGDEPHYALMAHSIATDFDLDLADDYAAVEAGSPAAGRKRAGQTLDRHFLPDGPAGVFAHPLGLPALAAPLLTVVGLFGDHPPDLPLGLLGLAVTFCGLLATWRALAVFLDDAGTAATLTFLGYLSSPLWFYSRTFFTEPYSWAAAALAVASLTAGRLLWATAFLFVVLAMKETGLLLVGPILLATVGCLGWRKGAVAAIGPAAFGALFVAKSLAMTGRPLAPFQPFQVGDVAAGAAGLLVDPSRGLLWFAPLLALGALGFLVPPRERRRRWVHGAAALAFAGYFLTSAAWVDWRGGSGFGPRLLVPALPALLVPLAGLVALNRRLWGLVAALFLAGFAVAWNAALDPVAAFWDAGAWGLVAADPRRTFAGVAVGVVLLFLCRRRLPRALAVAPGSAPQGDRPHASGPSPCTPSSCRG